MPDCGDAQKTNKMNGTNKTRTSELSSVAKAHVKKGFKSEK